jgi:hypothetical protein
MAVAVPIKYGSGTATSGGLKLYGDARVLTGSPFTDATSYNIRVWPVEPAALRPLTVAGTVAGLLAGSLPAYRFSLEAYAVLTYAPGSPDPRTVDGSHGETGTLTLICAVVGLLAIVTAAIVARRRPPVRAD